MVKSTNDKTIESLFVVNLKQFIVAPCKLGVGAAGSSGGGGAITVLAECLHYKQ